MTKCTSKLIRVDSNFWPQFVRGPEGARLLTLVAPLTRSNTLKRQIGIVIQSWLQRWSSTNFEGGD